MTSGADGSTDFDELLAARTYGKYPNCESKFLLRPPDGAEVLPCQDLLDREVFWALIDRYVLC